MLGRDDGGAPSRDSSAKAFSAGASDPPSDNTAICTDTGSGVVVDSRPGKVGPEAPGIGSLYWLMADNSLAFGGGAFASAPPLQRNRPRRTRPALAAAKTLALRRHLTPEIVLTAAVATLTFWVGYDGG